VALAVEPRPAPTVPSRIQADESVPRQARRAFQAFPIGFHLPPHPAHRIFADRTAKHRGERPAHPTGVGAGKIGAGNQANSACLVRRW